MLVLTRKLGETIYIGPDIAITVVDIERGRVRIGIQAPKDVNIAREELVRNAHLKPASPLLPIKEDVNDQ